MSSTVQYRGSSQTGIQHRPDHKRSGVRISAKRERTPDILDVQEMQLLLAALEILERTMVFLDMPSGLRRGELAGLK